MPHRELRVDVPPRRVVRGEHQALGDAVEALADSEDIYRRNIETLQTLGWDGWNALWSERTGKR